jgi:dTDP-glucose 4,6-dehydratase
MRILVTGGCGFIGSNFIRFLLQQEPDAQLVNLDLLTYAGNAANLADLHNDPRHRLVRGDVADRSTVRDLFQLGGFDSVFHLAAESHVDRSIHDSTPFVRTNVVGTQVLLDAAKEFGVRRYVQVSTDEVYGSLGPTGLFTETTPLAPSSPYSASKAAADLLVQSYHHTFDMPILITRCSNNYGPYQFPEKLIPLFVTNLLRGEQVPVYGDGLNVRDWIHVEDHCAGIYAVWKQGRPGEIYNLGGRCEKTNLDLTHLLLALTGRDTSAIRYVPDRPGHDRRYAIDCSKAERELGWYPKQAFAEGLAATVQWYRDQAEWIESIRSGSYRLSNDRDYPCKQGNPG